MGLQPEVYRSTERHSIEVRLSPTESIGSIERLVYHRKSFDGMCYAYCRYMRKVWFVRFDKPDTPFIVIGYGDGRDE